MSGLKSLIKTRKNKKSDKEQQSSSKKQKVEDSDNLEIEDMSEYSDEFEKDDPGFEFPFNRKKVIKHDTDSDDEPVEHKDEGKLLMHLFKYDIKPLELIVFIKACDELSHMKHFKSNYNL